MALRKKQVLILNITRMGDLIQMVPLLRRLEQEWPEVEIDVVVDTEFAAVARLLPGVRHVLAYRFQALMDDSRACARDCVSLYREIGNWAGSLLSAGYDRVINLSFNRRSAYLAGYVGAKDIRGLTAAPDGTVVARDPWMRYFLDMHAHRRFNRFNLVDVYALGGSGPGGHVPIALRVESEDRQWASRLLRSAGTPRHWIAVQVGASDVMKAWRPDSFGRAMATVSQEADVGFVLIGTDKEVGVVREAVGQFRRKGGRAPLCDAVGKTTIPQLVGLLSRCRLMLTNDTGPMHLAVGAGVPVVNVSVGHVDFRETGPYATGHWVVQPDIACGPCGFDQVCPHQACKDRILADEVAALCLHAMGVRPFPDEFHGARVYEAGVDADHLGTYMLRAGREDPVSAWYGQFWRAFWYEEFCGRPGKVVGPGGEVPDRRDVLRAITTLRPLLDSLCDLAEEFVRLSTQTPMPVQRLQEVQGRLKIGSEGARDLGLACIALSPITVAWIRDSQCLSAATVRGMAAEYAQAFRVWRTRLDRVHTQMSVYPEPIERESYACST